jgi:hypothetical protein
MHIGAILQGQPISPVGWAKAHLAVPTIFLSYRAMVGTPPGAFAPGRFAHPYAVTMAPARRM